MIKRTLKRQYEEAQISFESCCPMVLQSGTAPSNQRQSQSTSRDKRCQDLGVRKIKLSISNEKLNGKPRLLCRQGEINKRQILGSEGCQNNILELKNVSMKELNFEQRKEKVQSNKCRQFKNKIAQQHHRNLNIKINKNENDWQMEKQINSTCKNTPRDAFSTVSFDQSQYMSNIKLSDIKSINKNQSLTNSQEFKDNCALPHDKKAIQIKSLEELCNEIHNKKIHTIKSEQNESQFASQLDQSYIYAFDRLT